MKRKFEEIMEKVSENNNLMMEYAADFRGEIDQNYVPRRGIHLIYLSQIAWQLVEYFSAFSNPSKTEIPRRTRLLNFKPNIRSFSS